MDGLLTPISTTYTPAGAEPLLTLAEVARSATAPTAPSRQTFTASSADEALDILKNEPDYDSLVRVLRFLVSDRAPVDVRQPGPLAAQLVQVLVTAILPNYWPLLSDEDENKNDDENKNENDALGLLLACLRSVTGLGALTVRLRALLAAAKSAKSAKSDDDATDSTWQLTMLRNVLAKVLEGDDAVAEVWSATVRGADGVARRRPLEHEFLAVLGSGKVVSLAAEAEAVAEDTTDTTPRNPSWVASGRDYSLWLARNVVHWSRTSRTTDEQTVQAALLGKALRLGYPVVVSDVVHAQVGTDGLPALLPALPVFDQKKMLNSVLAYAADTFFDTNSDTDKDSDKNKNKNTVAAVAGLVGMVVGDCAALHEQLVQWLLTTPGIGLVHATGIRRAVVALLAHTQKEGILTTALGTAMDQLGDRLFVSFAPALEQDAKAQVVLLLAGYVHRQTPRALATLLRSRTYLRLVSGRLGASRARAKFLGMVVGEALSGLVDAGKQRLDFQMDETKTDEADWYRGLVHVQDTVGGVDLLRPRLAQEPAQIEPARIERNTKPTPKLRPKDTPTPKPASQPKTGFIIEEIVDDDDAADDAADDDLKAYGKPDSDAEDSDDDPTLITRNKPKAPVYVRDLIAYLRETDDYDKQRLALTTAPVLVRRKATFGTEVQQHAAELASLLIGLHDAFDMADFADLRQNAMLALVVAQPVAMGPRFAQAVFDGDYSVAQRASVLVALGLAAREMAGFEPSEHAAAATFPSQQLPARVERLYVSGEKPSADTESLTPMRRGALDSITDDLTASFLRPLAAQAADDAAGPDVLKLASFKSRLAAGAAGKTRAKTKSPRGTANTAGQLLAASFFFPLLSRAQLALQASAPVRAQNVVRDPSLLALLLRTLAVVLHAAGPVALALPDMTAELWGLLLGSRVQTMCTGDLLVTHAVLFALMALLDANEARMRALCRDLPREVVQTRDWALHVVEAMRHAGADTADRHSQENQVQMLAAGTYLRLSEGMESYRSLLLGEMIG